MKNIGAKLKGMDYKQLLVDHGEKLAFGLVGLFSVFALLSTNWSSFSEFTPEDLTRSISSATSQLESREWPEEQRGQHTETDSVREKSTHLRSEVDVRPYEYTVEMTWQLYPPVKKVQEPKWLRVEDVIADYGQVIVPILPTLDSETEGELASVDGKDEKDPKNNRFARRSPGTGAPGGDEISSILGGDEGSQYTPPGLGSGGAGYVPPGVGPGGSSVGSGSPEPGAYPGAYPGFPGGEMGLEGMGAEGNTMETQLSRGERYVAIRGVFPMDMQARRIFEATNATYERNAVRAIVRIFDFEVERKERVLRDTDDAWSDWNKVDLKVATEFMQQLASFDSPVVHSGVRDRVITNPLPGRILGFWGDHAWHPRIANYRLTPEQQRLADLRDEKLAELLQQNAELQRQQTEQQLGGFSGLQADGNQLAMGAMGIESASSAMAQLENATYLGNEMGMSATQAQQTMAELQGKDADGYILLFRYFDFDVEPGKSYQYRVRLKIKNPNALRKVDDVVDASVIAGDFRYTEWSDITKVTVVPEETHYFLSDVNTPRNAGFPMECNVDIYQWYQETGTTIYNNLELSLGSFIAGNPEVTKVLRPARPSLEDEEDIEFETEDFVVDLSDSIKLDIYQDKDLHAELGLSSKTKGRLGDSVEGLVLNSLGDLVALDPVSMSGLKSEKEQLVNDERAGFRDIEDMQKKMAEQTAVSALDERINELSGSGEGEEPAPRGSRSSRRRRNALRLGGGGYPGYPGGGYPGMGPDGCE